MALDLFLDVELLDPKPVGDRQWIGGLQVKEIVSRSKASVRLCAGSMLMTNVR